jgi:hypothetical protein
VTINTQDGGTITFAALLSNPTTATQMSGNYSITGGSCAPGDSGTVSMMKS